MDGFTTSDALYCRVFPVIVLWCILVGVTVYAFGSSSEALNCFLAVGFGVRLDNHIERRRAREAERQASAGWARLRAPVSA